MAVAEAYKQSYPELAIPVEVPYELEGSHIAVTKGNTTLLDKVNEAIAKALADGTMAQFVKTANELSSGEIYEGLLN